MKCIATISIDEANIDSVLEQKIQNIELSFFGSDEETIDSIVVHGVGISTCFVDKVVD